MDSRFRKYEKLKSQKIIDRIFDSGKSITAYPLKLFFIEETLNAATRFQTGFSVPKRYFKKAVHRNYIKRLMRENYRLNKQLLYANSDKNYALFFVFIGREMVDFDTVEKGVKKLMERFLAEENFLK